MRRLKQRGPPPHAAVATLALSLFALTFFFAAFVSSESADVAPLEWSDVLSEWVSLTSLPGDDENQNPPSMPSASVFAQSLSQASDFNNPPAQSFNDNARFDLIGKFIQFTHEDLKYGVCVEDAKSSVYPVDPALGQAILANNPDDTPQLLQFPTGFRPKFFGREISQSFFYASPNGYISFEFDESFDGDLETHFGAARISIFMTDFVKDEKCTISYNQPIGNIDAVTITWNNCHELLEDDKLHSFQLSLFRNGDVTMFYKDVTPTGADIAVGLSGDIAPIIGSLTESTRALSSLDSADASSTLSRMTAEDEFVPFDFSEAKCTGSKTPSPTRETTRAPTRAPTLAPTVSPIITSPTPAPTTFPAPSSDDEDVCKDDPEFSNASGKGCNWVAKDKSKRCKSKIHKQGCPLTCGVCSIIVTPAPTVPVRCVDDPNFRVGKDSAKDCKWVAKKVKSRCKARKTVEGCPATCGECTARSPADSSDRCKDDPAFLNAKGQGCDWVAEKKSARCEKRQNKIGCPFTCGECLDK